MKKILLSFLIVFFCVVSYAQDSITVYQGTKVQKFLLSEIDSITHNANNTMNIYHNDQKYGYSVMKVDSVSFSQDSQIEKEGTATIILNAEDPKVVTLTKNNGEILNFYGKKDEGGAVEYFTQMEYVNTEGQISLMEFYENGQIKMFTAPNDVTIEFEWVSAEDAAIKVYNPEDNSYIITNWNIHGSANAAKRLIHDNITSRSGSLVMTQIPEVYSMLKAPAKAPENRGYDVWVKKCDSPTNAKVYIKIVDGQNHSDFITSIYDYQYVTQGWYSFHIPNWTFPTTMPNKELLDNIDRHLSWIATSVSELTAAGVAIMPAIELALASTGIGAPPALVVEGVRWCVLGIWAVSTTLSYTNGVGLWVKTFNPKWYYQEEYTSIFVIPYVNGKAYPEEGYHVNFDDSDWGSTINLEGNPEIRSFDLSPKYPSAGQGYRASVFYRCIPQGSKIVMGIVGTDGYHNETTQTAAAESGSANLDVPGAAAGVYDVCTVKIYDTNGQLITSTQASLTFGQ